MIGQLLRNVQWIVASACSRGRLVNQILVVGVFTVVVKLVGLGRDVLLASTYGAGTQLDQLFLALVLPVFAINVLGGSVKSAFVPVFAKLYIENPENARSFLAATQTKLALVFGSTTVLLLLGYLAYSQLLASHSTSISDHSTAIILLVSIIPACFAQVFAATLNARQVLWLPSLTPLLAPLALAAVLILSPIVPPISWLAVSILVGYLIELLLLGVATKWIGLFSWPRFGGGTAEFKQFSQEYLVMIYGAATLSLVNVVDNFMASALPAGSVTSLNLGIKFTAALMTLMTLAVGTAVFPRFSGLVAEANYSALSHLVRKITRALALITTTLTLLLVLFSEQIIYLLFAHGSFDLASVSSVSAVQIAYALQIPFHVIGIIYSRLISSRSGNAILLRAAIITLAVNIIFNILLIGPLGAVGLALSTSIGYLASFVYLYCKAKIVGGIRN